MTLTHQPIYNTQTPVMVTGATGYVASWLVRRLLEEGFSVHAAVRDPGNEAKISHLKQMADQLPGDLTFFQTDLLKEGSYKNAMNGCETVFHTASPFIVNYEDPQTDLVDPALQGTQNVLNTANKTDSVKRVVLTSSCAAISGNVSEVALAPGGVLTEACWNQTSSLEQNPYSYSKTLAEKAAWEIADAQQNWKLVVINPALVLGPSASTRQTSASFDYVRMLGDGTFQNGAPQFQLGMVDVRDVAEAHMRAAFLPQAEGRHIVFAQSMALGDLANSLRETYGDKFAFPAFSTYEGEAWVADNSKSQNQLGIEYHDVHIALREMFQQLVDAGQITQV